MPLPSSDRAAEQLADDGAASWTSYATALLERAVLVAETGSSSQPADDAVLAAEALLERHLDAGGGLADLAANARLTPLEVRVLAVCGAVEVERRLQLLVARLLGDPSATRVDAGLLVDHLGQDALGVLAADSALVATGLLDVPESSALAAARVVVPRVVAWHLVGRHLLDPALAPQAEVVPAPRQEPGAHRLLLVHGPDRVRRVQAGVGAALGSAFLVTPAPADEAGWRAVVRQATVSGLGVLLEVPDGLDAHGRRRVAAADHLTWVLCSPGPLPLESLPDLPFAEVRAAAADVRDDEWAAAFPGADLPSRRPTADQVRLVRRLQPDGVRPPLRRLAAGSLLRHARRVEARATWADLILPPAQERRLRGLVDRYRYRDLVHDAWGLPLLPSPGVVALFSGPSGTGKTTSAEVIAHELGIDLFRVDLSALVSKYIGETEKNLEEIFSAAHAGDYLLLFDEADSLFGKRAEVSDARDRYANMEVSYLLQRLESYDGFVVLTSNFQGNIDEAFLRRIHAAVHFPIPKEEDRRRIWERGLAAAPLEDVDLGHLARAFELSGGAIRNSCLTAAFLAAGRGRPVGMPELLGAAAQELTKLRQRTSAEQLGPWADEVADLT
jgi:ATPase family protein associated with various cellular activities (AAA)